MGDVRSGGDRDRPGSAVLTPPTGLPPVDGIVVPAPRRPRHDDRPAVVAPSSPPAVRTGMCACGHGRDAHEHYRPGRDCGACGAVGCADYRPRGGPLRRLLRAMGLTG